jgi:hypothetical protein
MGTSYSVMNKKTRQMFAGFDAENQPIWTDDEHKACAYSDRSEAHGQALLFARFGLDVQKKPMAITKEKTT